MRVTFATTELRDACDSFQLAEKLVGRHSSQSLLTVIAEIEACQDVEDFQNLRGSECLVEEKLLHISIEQKYDLVFSLNASYNAATSPDQIDVGRVTTLQLLHIREINESD